MKSISNNFYVGPHAYLNTGWNRLEFAVLLLDCASVGSALDSSCWAFTGARAARGLSLPRALGCNALIHVLLQGMGGTLELLSYVLLFQLLNTLVWSILAKELVAHKLHRCSGPGADYPNGKALCSGAYVSLPPRKAAEGHHEALLLPRSWHPPLLHLDCVFTSCMAMLSCSALHWVCILKDCMDSTSQNVGPREDAN